MEENNLSSLIRRLRDEAAFVQSEKKHLITLYKQVSNVVIYFIGNYLMSFVRSWKNPRHFSNNNGQSDISIYY